MAVDNRITKKRVQHHLHYEWWKYLVTVLIVTLAFSMVFLLTEYTPPPEKRIEVILAGYYVDEPTQLQLEETLLATLPEDQEQVTTIDCPLNIVSGMAVLETSNDLTSFQRLQVQFAARRGNVFLMPIGVYEEFANQGGFMSLDEMIENGTLQVDAEEAEKLRTFVYEFNDEGEQERSDEPEHIYGLPLWNAAGLQKHLGYDPAEVRLVIAIPHYAQNMDNTVRIVQWFLDQTN